MGEQGDAITADPHSANEAPTIAAALQVHDALVDRDQNMKLIAGLATEWGTLSGQRRSGNSSCARA